MKGENMIYERIVIAVLLVLLVGAILLPRGGGGNASPVPDVLTVIHQRKSVRNYTAEPVAEQELDQLVRAGFAAPSARLGLDAGLAIPELTAVFATSFSRLSLLTL